MPALHHLSLLSLFLLAFLWLPVSALQAQEAPIYPEANWADIDDPASVGYDAEALAQLETYAESLSTTGLMVIVGGRVLMEYGDVEELSYLASVRKSVLAILYGTYVADGTIDLNKTLAEMEMDDHGGLLPNEQQATVEDLIAARSGIYHPASNPGDNTDSAPTRGSQQPSAYFLYNNWDFNAAGGAFEAATGKDLFDALATDLAEPIGMQDFDRSRQRKLGDLTRSKYPAYHMWLSTRDMARVGYLMLREGRWQNDQVVPAAWAQKIVSLITPVEEMNPQPMRQGPFGYGYMWWVWEEGYADEAYAGAYTARGAYGQYITVLPALDLVVAHKTAVPPSRSVRWSEYQGILDRIIAARCEGTCR